MGDVIGEPRAQGVATGSKKPVLGSMCKTFFGLLPALGSVSLSKTVAGFASACELHVRDIGEIVVVHSKPGPFAKQFCMANTAIFTANTTFQSNHKLIFQSRQM